MEQHARRSIFGKVDPDKVLRFALRMIPFAQGGPELLDILRDLKTSRTELEAKVARATESLKEASSLVEELDGELSERMRMAQELQVKYERYKSLANAHEAEAEALLKEMEGMLSKGRGKERAISFGLGLVGGLIVFILGVILGPTVQGWFGIGP